MAYDKYNNIRKYHFETLSSRNLCDKVYKKGFNTPFHFINGLDSNCVMAQ